MTAALRKVTSGRRELSKAMVRMMDRYNWLLVRIFGFPESSFRDNLQNRKLLWDFIKRNKCKTILEIGLGDGRNVKKMLDLAGDCDYYGFDNLSLPESRKAFLELEGRRNVHFYIGDTRETLPLALSELPMMDLIFIDGGHGRDVVENDWNICKLLMHDGTACFFHDYYPCLGVKRVVDKIGDDFSVEIINLGVGPYYALVTTTDESLMSCIRTLLEIEHGEFPDEACIQCENLSKCEKLCASALGR